LQFQNPVSENDEIIFTQAGTLADSGQYAQAKTKYMQLVNQYPGSEYAAASLKELLSIEKSSTEDFSTLKSYYTSVISQCADSSLCKTADFLSNLCNIQMENYSNAIGWYENVIQDPPTFEDSLFAIIDLGNLYLKMENDSLKAAPIGSLTEYIPQSEKQYSENREYLISLLFKDESLIESPESALGEPKAVQLLPNMPNPFCDKTTIRYTVSEDSYITIKIIDYSGRIVATRDEGWKNPGQYQCPLTSGNFGAGVYFCTIECNGVRSDSQKISVMK